MQYVYAAIFAVCEPCSTQRLLLAGDYKARFSPPSKQLVRDNHAAAAAAADAAVGRF